MTPAAMVLALAAPAVCQDPPGIVFSEEVSVEWVTVPVVVIAEPDGRRVGRGDAQPLGTDDFVLLVDGREVTLESFDHGQAPFGLVYAQDLSGSMALGDKLDLSRNAFSLLLARTGQQDEMAVVTFAGGHIEVQVPFTSERAPLEDAANFWQGYGTTALYDALGEIAEIARSSQRSRRALAVVTDGVDNASEIAPGHARSLLQGAGLPVYVLDVAPRFERDGGPPARPGHFVEVASPESPDSAGRADRPDRFEPHLDLAELALATGGRYFEVTDHGAMQQASRAVIDDLQRQFLLGFTTDPVGDSSWHEIVVQLTSKEHAGSRLHHRTRYYGAPPAHWATAASSAASAVGRVDAGHASPSSMK